MKKRVAVALSGGIDSAVCALLLKEEGYEVIGVTMRLLENESATRRIDKAKEIAEKIRIPHYVVDFRDAFKEYIIRNFCEEFKRGRTPNPCIRCNEYIKFGILLKEAKQLGAEYLATGHYARIEYCREKGKYLLKKGCDPEKDQSYFLYRLTQKKLPYILMPLGNYNKKRVKEIARGQKLSLEAPQESQEVCFILENNYSEFLKRYFSQEIKPGPILDTRGKLIGEHKGIPFYTIGQRRGLGISSRMPLYVVNIDEKENTLIVGPESELYRSNLEVCKVSYVAKRIEKSLNLKIKIRYRHQEALAEVHPGKDGKAYVKFTRPQRAITPGQAAVFYNEDVVVGGGIIEKVLT